MAESYGPQNGYIYYDDYIQSWCTVSVSSESDTQITFKVQAQLRLTNCYQYGVKLSVGYYNSGSSGSYHDGATYSTYYTAIDNGWYPSSWLTDYYTFDKGQSSRSVTFYAWARGETVSGYGAYPASSEAKVSMTIPARTYNGHGKPTVSASPNHCEVGDSVKISWAKSSTQGNAAFTRFELWQGSSKLYSGTATSKTVTPSTKSGGTYTYVVKEIHTWYGAEKTTQNQVSVVVRIPHGVPGLSSNITTANYGESVTLSWSKASTQGNASFKRFELWQSSTKIYSGTAISKAVIPSTYSGPKGGNVVFTLKEIHDWYGSEKTTQKTITINVRSGVVTVYDANGAKHTGLVTAYDASGAAHYVLITAYDSSGKPHSVV